MSIELINAKFAKQKFLFILNLVYLIAFSSLYVQIPGLYGDNGILPASKVLLASPKSINDFFATQPSLLRFVPMLGIDCELGLQLFCLLGIFYGILMIVFKSLRVSFSYLFLWLLYFSIYQVGQTFLHFQWDILLLEAGFLGILVAPVRLNLFCWQSPWASPHDNVTLWLVQWLFFRLMFASGVVKLTSGCPTWWGLTALDWHYESQCIPTPLAWYFHHIPKWFQSWSVVATYIIEIAVPLLFIVPVSNIRLFAFGSQILFQILIILTGNYNFFNLLTIGLSFSLLQDGDVGRSNGRKPGKMRRLISMSFSALIYWILFHYSCKLFDLHFKKDGTLASKVKFTSDEFDAFLDSTVPTTMYVAGVCLMFKILTAFLRSLTTKGFCKRLWHVTSTLAVSCLAVGIFTMSLVPYSYINEKAHNSLPSSVKDLHKKFNKYEIVNSYGLFRRMTGVGGRPEVIIEGSNDDTLTKWQPYEFWYKPGNLNRAPPIVAPHQPRLDWQMWFAALGSYNHNPWFINFVYRLLQNEPSVLELLRHNPFPTSPPKYIRARLFKYHFSNYNPKQPVMSWWTRNEETEYLPPIAATDASLLKYLKEQGVVGKVRTPKPNTTLSRFLIAIQGHIGQQEGFSFVSGVLVAASLLHFINKRFLSSLGF